MAGEDLKELATVLVSDLAIAQLACIASNIRLREGHSAGLCQLRPVALGIGGIATALPQAKVAEPKDYGYSVFALLRPARRSLIRRDKLD